MSRSTTLPSSLEVAQRELLDRVPSDLLIERWQPASGDARFPVLNPATGRELATVADASPAEAHRALVAAEDARDAWAGRSSRQRADILRRAFDLVSERAEDFALLITLEMGKPLAEARAEVAYGAQYLRWYSEEAVRMNGRATISPDGRFRIVTSPEPVGPCLLITPWNFPLTMGLRKIAPALAAGCTVVLKPAALTPLSSLLAGEILLQAGLPPGVVNVVTTSDSGALGRQLIADPRLRKVSFTGSTAVGRQLLTQCADGVLRTSMELGGNAPLLVFEDAELERAVEGAVVAKLRNGGQSCVAANRILVQETIAQEFISRFADRMDAAVVGPGISPDTTVGPLIDDRACARVSALVEDAVTRGARVVAGGSAPGQGSFFSPTVLAEVSPKAQLLHEEIFGPVAPIVSFETESEAVAIANSTPYGLAAYLFTSNLDRATRVASLLETGMVGINQGLVSEVAAPFGGIKHSGLGREGGPEGLDEYTQIKYVAQRIDERGDEYSPS